MRIRRFAYSTRVIADDYAPRPSSFLDHRLSPAGVASDPFAFSKEPVTDRARASVELDYRELSAELPSGVEPGRDGLVIELPDPRSEWRGALD